MITKQFLFIIFVASIGVIGCKPTEEIFLAPFSTTQISDSEDDDLSHEWDAEPVLVYLFDGPGYTSSDVAWSFVPSFILYSDGQVFISDTNYLNQEFVRNYYHGQFTKEETCEFLFELEEKGFLNYDPKDYDEPQVTDMGTTEINMRVWKNNYVSAYALGAFSSGRLAEIYNTIQNKSIPNKTQYTPDKIALKITSYGANQAAPIWPFEQIPISSLIEQATREVVILSGEESKLIHTYYGNRVTIRFRDNDTTYHVTIKSIFPFEKTGGDSNPWRDFPGFENKPKTKMSCPPDESPTVNLFEVNPPQVTGTEVVAITPCNTTITPCASASNEVIINIVGTIGSRNAAGQLYMPWALMVNSDNEIVVADTGNDRLQWFDMRGNYIKSVAVEDASIYDISQGFEDNIIMADGWQDRIIIASGDGEIIRIIDDLPIEDTEFTFSAIVQGPDQSIYLSGYNASHIIKIYPEGQIEILNHSTFSDGIQSLGVDGKITYMSY